MNKGLFIYKNTAQRVCLQWLCKTGEFIPAKVRKSVCKIGYHYYAKHKLFYSFSCSFLSIFRCIKDYLKATTTFHTLTVPELVHLSNIFNVMDKITSLLHNLKLIFNPNHPIKLTTLAFIALVVSKVV